MVYVSKSLIFDTVNEKGKKNQIDTNSDTISRIILSLDESLSRVDIGLNFYFFRGEDNSFLKRLTIHSSRCTKMCSFYFTVVCIV